jgi:hypothetical protein
VNLALGLDEIKALAAVIEEATKSSGEASHHRSNSHLVHSAVHLMLCDPVLLFGRLCIKLDVMKWDVQKQGPVVTNQWVLLPSGCPSRRHIRACGTQLAEIT